ncbi:MAG: DUF3857 domain-containing protein [Myxococcales bacterium]|nr:DUF3857 domain-containing protein [Myxococcales bacterium]
MRMVVFVGAFVAAAAGLAAAGPLDKPAFTATPAELLAEARAANAAGHDVVVLREDVDVTFDARGRSVRRNRVVFAIVAASAVDGWGTLRVDWSPFYQERPLVRARVIGADGTSTDFDPKLMQDAPTVSESPTVFSDRRDLSVPLPRLAVGAVVEEELTFTDREPLLAAGTQQWVPLARPVPKVRQVVTISAPTALKARVALRGPAVTSKPQTRRVGDRTIVSLDLRDVAPSEPGVEDAGPDYLAVPYLGIGTAPSWAAVASDYRALVEERLAAGVALPPDLKGATPRATVDRVVAWLHARVRYTGIELSQSAIVPFAPAETLARGFGDCKDKATLLVALLRAAGITADVALLATGPGFDVDAGLPGMGGFDHAIVRAVVGGKDLWIDATEELLPAGQLPVRDQGRRALIIAAGTKALTPTPLGAAADNLIREVRTFHLVEQGAGTVSEASEQRGVWSDDLRGWIRSSTHKDVDERLRAYIKKEYVAELTAFRHSDPGDIATPFTLTIDATDVGRVEPNGDELVAWIYGTDTFDRLPPALTDSSADAEDEAKARTVDFFWAAPHVYEVVNRFELPPGYTAPDLPAQEQRSLGAVTLTIRRERTPGALTVTYRLDTGKPRITADAVRATRAALKAFHAESASRVVIELEAARLKNAGKHIEAVAEYRRLIALHPKEGLHHAQLAFLLSESGLGDAARREAKLATTLSPDDARGWVALAWALKHDSVSREHRPGVDRAGSIAAYKKALALFPAHAGAKRGLAETLASDDRGRIASAADLAAAATLRLELRADGDDLNPTRIIYPLAIAGDAKRLEEFARGLPASRDRRVAEVMVALLRGTVADAVRVADAVSSGDERRDVLMTLSSLLMATRRYQDARRAQEAITGSLSAPDAASFDRLAAIDLTRLPPRDPTTPVKVMFARLLLGPVARPPWNPAVEATLVERARTTRFPASVRNMPMAASLDLAIGTASFVAEGSDKLGWRVRIEGNGATANAYVALEGGRAVLLGTDEATGPLGAMMLDRLARKDLEAPRRWLARVAEDLGRGSSRTGMAGFAARHKAALATADTPLLELFAALLLTDDDAKRTAPILRRCAGLTDTADVTLCRQATRGALARSGDLAGAAAVARELVDTDPDNITALDRLVGLLADDGHGADAIAVLTPYLDRRPDDPVLLESRAYAALSIGWTEAEPWFARTTAPADASVDALNNAAWSRLYFEPTPAAARALMERAAARSSSLDRGADNTYAAILAEAGEPAAAWARLVEHIDETEEVANADWYVIGRCAEQLGMRDDAIAIYRRVAKPKRHQTFPSPWDFAQRRLKAMGVTP